MKLTDENIAAYADTLVLQARGAGRILDYSAASLTALEEAIRADDDLLQAESFPDRQRNLLIFYNGCYLGETIFRNLGGVWRFAENWYESSLVLPHGNGSVQVHPFHKVFRRLSEGPEGNNLAEYYHALQHLAVSE